MIVIYDFLVETDWLWEKGLTAFIPCPKKGTMAWAASPISTQCDFRWKEEHFTDIMGCAGNRKKSRTRACLRGKQPERKHLTLGIKSCIILADVLTSLPLDFTEKYTKMPGRKQERSKTGKKVSSSSWNSIVVITCFVLNNVNHIQPGQVDCTSRTRNTAVWGVVIFVMVRTGHAIFSRSGVF